MDNDLPVVSEPPVLEETEIPVVRQPRRQKRKGSIVVLAAFFMIAMLAFVAFAVDLGYLYNVRTEAQSCADAAALAAAWEIIGEARLRGDDIEYETDARNKAMQFATLNEVAQVAHSLDANWLNDIDGEIVIGRIDDPSNRNDPMVLNDPRGPNAITVRVRRSASRNGEVNLFFAQTLGANTAEVTAEATATFRDDVTGFRVTSNTGNATLLPFVVHEDDWAQLQAGNGNDNWAYSSVSNSSSPYCSNSSSNVSAGPDQIREINMFPQQTTGNHITPGNFGTVNLNANNNSASTLRRLIREGPNQADMATLGGSIELDPVSGTLDLGGDPGMTASMQLALADIIGQPRTIMLYRQAVGQGNNTVFTIVGFVGVRVMAYSLNGQNKYITVQPAFVVDGSAVVGEGSNSYFVGQPIHLSR